MTELIFDVTLEDNCTNKLIFVTVEDCKNIDELIDHIHHDFPSCTINSITLK